MVMLLLGHTVTSHAQSSSRQKRTPATTKSKPQADEEFDKQVKLGEEARIAGRLDEAIDSYRKALTIRPKWPDGWWYMGALYYEKDLYPQARDSFRNLVSLDATR